jgi:zinc protease
MNQIPRWAARWACAATIAVFAVLAAPATQALAQPGGKATVETPEKVASIEGITEYRLKNGCKLLLFPDEAASTITVNMTIFVGSRFEGYGETGMAHLLEHMLFKGSKNFPKADQILSQFGGAYNGSTWTDRTNYYETMAANDKNLDLAIRFEADRLVNCFVRHEDLRTEMTVVRNEFEMGENNPDYILSQRLYSAAFEWHNYGKSTIGNRADIERVPIDRLQAFYRTYYQPDNCMLIIAGKFDPAKALKLAAQHFGAIKAPTRVLNQTYTEEPPQDGERVVTLRRVGKVAAVGALYHIPAAAHPDNAAFEVLGLTLGMHPAGRLYKALVETKKATDVQTNVTNWHDPGVFEVGATVTGNTKPEEVRDILLDVVENIKTKPITQDEVNRAVKNYLSYQEQAFAKSQRIAIELSEWAGAGDWRLMFIHRDRIAKVKADDVNRVALKYLQPSNRTAGMFLPTARPSRASVPEAPDVVALAAEYKGGKALKQGEAFDPTPENIEARVKRLTLANGMKVALLSKKTRGEAVVGSFALHFGNEKSLVGKTTAANFLGSLMTRGTEKKTRQQIQDELDKLSSQLILGSSAGSLNGSIQTSRSRLGEVLALARECLREPTFPEAELEILKRSQKEALEKSLTDEKALASNFLKRKLNPYPASDIHYQPTFEESMQRLAKLTRADIVQMYHDQIGPDFGEFVLVGDFDPVAVVPQLEKMFAGWKSHTPYARIPRTAQTQVAGHRETIQVNDKENAILFAALQFPLRDDDPEYPAVEMANFVLGGGGFTSRLMERLRQKEGWSYGAGSQVHVDSQDKNASILMYAIFNPKVVDKVDAGALEEVTKLLNGGIPPEEMNRCRSALLEELKLERGKDVMLAALLRSDLHLGRTFRFQADLEKKIAEVRPEEVTSALGRYLDVGRLVIVRSGDFSKNKKK